MLHLEKGTAGKSFTDHDHVVINIVRCSNEEANATYPFITSGHEWTQSHG